MTRCTASSCVVPATPGVTRHAPRMLSSAQPGRAGLALGLGVHDRLHPPAEDAHRGEHARAATPIGSTNH